MRKIYTTTFVTLDGVMQAPGGPEEDTSNGFKYGGWQFAWDEGDKDVEDIMNKMMARPFDLLLGHLTYEIWSGYWPKHKDEPVWGIPFDKATKYVVAHKPFEPSWDKSELITGDIVEKIKKLKSADGPDLSIWGSSKLIQTLLEHNLIDEMNIWIYPITIGSGKKLFAEGTQPERFKVVDSKITSTGVVIATYEPVEPLKENS